MHSLPSHTMSPCKKTPLGELWKSGSRTSSTHGPDRARPVAGITRMPSSCADRIALSTFGVRRCAALRSVPSASSTMALGMARARRQLESICWNG
eukprot:scaffold211344_cov22-Tisochrysis_lutea.AAC.1